LCPTLVPKTRTTPARKARDNRAETDPSVLFREQPALELNQVNKARVDFARLGKPQGAYLAYLRHCPERPGLRPAAIRGKHPTNALSRPRRSPLSVRSRWGQSGRDAAQPQVREENSDTGIGICLPSPAKAIRPVPRRAGHPARREMARDCECTFPPLARVPGQPDAALYGSQDGRPHGPARR